MDRIKQVQKLYKITYRAFWLRVAVFTFALFAIPAIGFFATSLTDVDQDIFEFHLGMLLFFAITTFLLWFVSFILNSVIIYCGIKLGYKKQAKLIAIGHISSIACFFGLVRMHKAIMKNPRSQEETQNKAYSSNETAETIEIEDNKKNHR